MSVDAQLEPYEPCRKERELQKSGSVTSPLRCMTCTLRSSARQAGHQAGRDVVLTREEAGLRSRRQLHSLPEAYHAGTHRSQWKQGDECGGELHFEACREKVRR